MLYARCYIRQHFNAGLHRKLCTLDAVGVATVKYFVTNGEFANSINYVITIPRRYQQYSKLVRFRNLVDANFIIGTILWIPILRNVPDKFCCEFVMTLEGSARNVFVPTLENYRFCYMACFLQLVFILKCKQE